MVILILQLIFIIIVHNKKPFSIDSKKNYKKVILDLGTLGDLPGASREAWKVILILKIILLLIVHNKKSF